MGEFRFIHGALVLGALAALVAVFFWLNPPGGAGDAGGVSSVELELDGQKLAIGDPAPEFSATTVQGEQISLAGFRGQPVWVVVNATWCASCRSEIPDIKAAHAEFGDQVAILAIYLGEDEATVSEFAERMGLEYRNIPDPDSAISRAYAVPGIPVHYFIDGAGILRSIEIGSLGEAGIRSQLEALVN